MNEWSRYGLEEKVRELTAALAKTEAMLREERAKVRELEMRLLDIKRMAERG